MKNPLIILYISINIFAFTGCHPSDETVTLWDQDQYLGHVKLDSTELIVTEVAANLEVPWEIAYGPEGWIWFTEQKGSVSRVDPETGEKQILLRIPDVLYKKSLGLTSMALHPNFDKNPYVYLHYTYAQGEQPQIIKSRLVRYTYDKDTLVSPLILLDSIPGKTYHNGSRIIITPEQQLFLTLGDAGEKELSQNLDHLNGKILRLNADGTIPQDNPIKGSPIWSYGHRNVQGLVYASTGILYSSEHGVNNDDEINVISKGHNYGWPNVEGFCDLPVEKEFCKEYAITEPIFTWSPTVAVAGLDYYDNPAISEWKNSLILCNLKGRALRVLNLSPDGNEITSEHIFFQKRYGRIRDVCISPEGDIYLSTSNLDWHPRLQPWMYDSLPVNSDRIIRLQVLKDDDDTQKKLGKVTAKKVITEDSAALEMATEVWDFQASEDNISDGQALYIHHCATCHRANGKGAEGLFPPVKNTEWVTGDKSGLIQVLLRGLSGPIDVNGVTYEQEMPSFASLEDEELAYILTYIRNSFGNNANAVIAGEVFEERKAAEHGLEK